MSEEDKQNKSYDHAIEWGEFFFDLMTTVVVPVVGFYFYREVKLEAATEDFSVIAIAVIGGLFYSWLTNGGAPFDDEKAEAWKKLRQLDKPDYLLACLTNKKTSWALLAVVAIVALDVLTGGGPILMFFISEFGLALIVWYLALTFVGIHRSWNKNEEKYQEYLRDETTA